MNPEEQRSQPKAPAPTTDCPRTKLPIQMLMGESELDLYQVVYVGLTPETAKKMFKHPVLVNSPSLYAPAYKKRHLTDTIGLAWLST